MIIQRLTELADRLLAEGKLPPLGMQKKKIDFVIELNPDGSLVGIKDMREGAGKKKQGREYDVPQEVVRTLAVKPNLLWDKAKYALGIPTENAEEHFESFLMRIRSLPPEVGADAGVAAQLRFLSSPDCLAQLQKDMNWKEIAETAGNIAFRLVGDAGLVCQRPAVQKHVATNPDTGENEKRETETSPRVCIITGTVQPSATLHPKIKGFHNGQSSGNALVAYNSSSFESHGWTQGENAPIGIRTALAYTGALNWLLASDTNSFREGDLHVVFWAAEPDAPLEGVFSSLFNPPGTNEDGEEPTYKDGKSIRAALSAPRSGHPPITDDPTPFYVLGLSPNAARIVVRFWQEDTVGKIAERIIKWFDDLELIKDGRDTPSLSLHRLLSTLVLEGDVNKRLAPGIAADVMQAVLTGAPLPCTVLGAAITRCQKEHDVPHARAALIKACLNRLPVALATLTKEEMNVSLDPDNTNPGYRLGRLFAALEKIQENAQPGINSTIRDRSMASASSTPSLAFPRLMRLATHHLSKLERGESYWNGVLGDIVNGIGDFPPTLSLEDQGRFFIGYYHQRQKFFERKSEQAAA